MTVEPSAHLPRFDYPPTVLAADLAQLSSEIETLDREIAALSTTLSADKFEQERYEIAILARIEGKNETVRRSLLHDELDSDPIHAEMGSTRSEKQRTLIDLRVRRDHYERVYKIGVALLRRDE